MEAYRQSREALLFIILIPLINGLNYFITYSDIQFNRYFLLTLGFDTLLGYLTWLLIRGVIFYLEKKWVFIPLRASRIVLQLTLTSITSLVPIALITEFMNFLFRDTPVPTHFYTHDMVIFFIWVLVINGIYIGLYLYWHVVQFQAEALDAVAMESKYILVDVGRTQHKLPLNEAAGFFVSTGYYYTIDYSGNVFLIDFTLDRLESELPESLYFRVNRKFLLHRNSITSFAVEKHRKLRLSTVLDNYLEEPIIISRLRAKAFKEWIRQDVASK